MPKKFLCGVGNLFYYDKSDNLIFQSRTMLSNAIEVSISNESIKAGQGNVLQMLYFHSPEMKITAEESQFNLDMVASSVGSSITTGAKIWYEEQITLTTGGAGVATKTPVATSGSTIYGWFTRADNSVVRVTFTGSNFTVSGGVIGEVGCLRYYIQDSATRSLTISGNFIPSVGKLVLESQLFSGDSVTSSSLIGKVFVEIPSATMMGAVNLNLSSSGVSNTPIDFMALSSTPAGCSNSGVYAYVKEQIFASNWYDNVVALAFTEDPMALSTATSPKTVTLYAIPSTGSAFIPPYADITWSSSDASKFTVTNGVLTKVAAGSGNLTATITSKNTITTQAVVTVS